MFYLFRFYVQKYSLLILGIAYFILGCLIYFQHLGTDISNIAGIVFMTCGILYFVYFFYRKHKQENKQEV